LTIAQAFAELGSVRRLYKGYSVALLRGLPAASITFSVQHHVAEYIERYRSAR
jgi:hypothetical protein